LRAEGSNRILRSKQGPNRNVPIDVFPVNSDAPADESPVGALLGRGAEKSRKPLQRRRNTATVHERDDQFVIGTRNIDRVTHEACASAGAGGLMPRSAATSKLACGPFTDSALHLLVGDEPALFDVALGFAHGGQKRDFVGDVPIINVIWKAIYGLKDLILNAHE